MQYKPSPVVLFSWSILCLLPGLVTAILLWVVLRHLWPIMALPVVLVWLGSLFLLVAVYLPQRRKRMTFTLTGEALTLTGGVLFTVCHRMPLTAVRHVTLLQGPVEKLCGIAFLSVSGLGGHILLEGLEQKQAESWCHQLLCHG